MRPPLTEYPAFQFKKNDSKINSFFFLLLSQRISLSNYKQIKPIKDKIWISQSKKLTNSSFTSPLKIEISYRWRNRVDKLDC